MTPAQLEVERDRLLEGGRTLEEVRLMQSAPEFRDALESALTLMQFATFANGDTFNGFDEGEMLAQRRIDQLRALLSSHVEVE
ncbi:MAG: hypothetical protein ACOZQL_10560 [Myxococcota bacterium]